MRLLMIIKLLICVAVLLGGVLVLSSCRTAEIVSYVHEPSEDFYRDMNYEADQLNEFKDGGTLFVVDVKEVRRDQYLVWLGLYSDERQSLTINGARIVGDDWNKKNQINKNITIDSAVPDSGLMKDSVQLFAVEGGLLNQVVSNGSDIMLEVNYTIAGSRKTMTFSLERRVEKQTIFRT